MSFSLLEYEYLLSIMFKRKHQTEVETQMYIATLPLVPQYLGEQQIMLGVGAKQNKGLATLVYQNYCIVPGEQCKSYIVSCEIISLCKSLQLNLPKDFPTVHVQDIYKMCIQHLCDPIKCNNWDNGNWLHNYLLVHTLFFLKEMRQTNMKAGRA